MNQPEKKRMGKCPSCGENINLGDRQWVGQLFNCKLCGFAQPDNAGDIFGAGFSAVSLDTAMN